MKRTPVLLRQHIGWHFAKHWAIQSKKKVLDSGAEAILKEKNFKVHKAEEILKEKRVYERVEVVGYKGVPIKRDKTHPDWHDRQLLTYKDNNVLLAGLAQAKLLTKTVELKQGLPEKLVFPDISKNINNRVKNILLRSLVFDAEQKKLPKIKDPERPAWNFPRIYGITQNRAQNLLTSRLMQFIETTSDENLVKDRFILNDLYFSFPFEKNGDIIQFELSSDLVVTSSKPLSPITLSSTKEFELPDIFPIKPTVTLNKENIYVVQNIYPINSNNPKSHLHTLILNFDKEKVKNLFEEEVTEEQIFGRSLLKTFTAAASYAKRLYGDEVKELPKPVSLQCVQTDGKFFHFGVLQLNTLDLEQSETKTVWFQTPLIDLFDSCQYSVGKPVLEGYNGEVIKHLYGFYNNV